LSYQAGIQSDLLSFVAQESIAHAGLIFATLTAAFTFAVGFGKRLNGTTQKVAYFLVLSLLFTLSCYAGLRLLFYGQLTNAVLNYPPEYTSMLCTDNSLDPRIHVGGLTWYYFCLRIVTFGGWHFFIPLDYFGGVTIPSLITSVIVGVVLALVFTRLFTATKLSKIERHSIVNPR
jgi:RsiW-degrading membrane proteinase PrsW (M82 family)